MIDCISIAITEWLDDIVSRLGEFPLTPPIHLDNRFIQLLAWQWSAKSMMDNLLRSNIFGDESRRFFAVEFVCKYSMSFCHFVKKKFPMIELDFMGPQIANGLYDIFYLYFVLILHIDARWTHCDERDIGGKLIKLAKAHESIVSVCRQHKWFWIHTLRVNIPLFFCSINKIALFYLFEFRDECESLDVLTLFTNQ